ncbi:HupE/UreJ family protein [Nocardia sp. NPDC127579]|uniref:HupE/UreJ family protein n=1 Tax=Nocardia sp. NPDC127579 TaxID=3345402 RepID=UPI0036419E50
MRRILRYVLAATGSAAVVLLHNPIPVSAHPMPGTSILLDVGESAIEAELSIPAGDLAEASGIDLNLRADLSADSAALATYVRERVRPATRDGVPWTVEINAMRMDYADGSALGSYKELVVDAALTPPPNADPRRFTLSYDVVIREVATHTAVVSARRAGQVDAAHRLGVLRMTDGTVAPLSVDLTAAATWQGFTEMVVLGGHHILEGTDHLLFLFTLLLPAVLISEAGRWRSDNRWRRAVRHITAVTIAFTLGHSVALVVSALTRAQLPAVPVETLIAATILVGGVHMVRPLFPGREAVVAGAFGVIHGLAFSFTLTELHLSTGQLALSVLGFNLGIEAVQLVLVALALPSLLALATTRAQPILRVGSAALVIIAALGWALDRVGIANPVAAAADRLGGWVLPIIALAAVAGAVPAIRSVCDTSPSAHRRRHIRISLRNSTNNSVGQTIRASNR